MTDLLTKTLEECERELKEAGATDPPLKELKLQRRAFMALVGKRDGRPSINTIEKLCSCTKEQLLERRHLGRKTLAHIESQLSKLGMSLARN